MASQRSSDLAERAAAARRAAAANVRQLEITRSRLLATQQHLSVRRETLDALRDSAIARLRARLESQPVIEQAKGILIAQVGCTPDEAFTLLRAASQRTNVRVKDLARDIVDHAASEAPGSRRTCDVARSPVA